MNVAQLFCHVRCIVPMLDRIIFNIGDTPRLT